MDNSSILEELETLEKFVKETPCGEIIKIKDFIVEQLKINLRKMEGIDDLSISQRLLDLADRLRIISCLPPERWSCKLSDLRLDKTSLIVQRVEKFRDSYLENQEGLSKNTVRMRQKRQFSDFEMNIIANGEGIDIGCSVNPISASAVGFDMEDGDANEITKYVNRPFDWVYSAHCLEHMYDPYKTLPEWWKLVKSGGYMIIYVPDEDLYEQGHFPSIYNPDHKTTFTIKKEKSWSP
ncbi:MAG: class I SAM-dependent methyltransferase, partial [Candidatus Accumulibacter sp.]|nr:class I SAM-dependent methyltransferase [Accumulibacter sp.]